MDGKVVVTMGWGGIGSRIQLLAIQGRGGDRDTVPNSPIGKDPIGTTGKLNY